MAGMGHQKKSERLEMDCPACGKKLVIILKGHKWQSTRLKSYWRCLACDQKDIRVKGSKFTVVKV